MALINKDQKYKWNFDNIGGCSRVRISSGQDIAHLDELDVKMWTVLSCPVKGLEIEEKSLKYMDRDADGKIRVNDVISVAKWMTGALKNPDLLLEGKDWVDIAEIDAENEVGLKLGKQIAGLINIFNPDLVIVGGTLSFTETISCIPSKRP